MSGRYSQRPKGLSLVFIHLFRVRKGEFLPKIRIFTEIGSGNEPGETPVILIKKWKLLKKFCKVSKKYPNVIDSDKTRLSTSKSPKCAKKPYFPVVSIVFSTKQWKNNRLGHGGVFQRFKLWNFAQLTLMVLSSTVPSVVGDTQRVFKFVF